ncbi:R3H domain-containing protein 4-like [Planococcus citri]|uniref:R3H domain-containing protein 4-like n=1 Tax=Planococcus citri TaxID=170843 RepID=UPI0031F81ABA
MGILDIIENGEQDIPLCDSFVDEINDEDDFPVIYSDTSSDTASVGEAIDDFMPSVGENESDNLIEDLNWINDSNSFLDESISYVNDNQNDMDMLVVINLDATQPSSPPANINNVEKRQTNFLNKFKNISAKNKTNLGKRKARRYENARQLDLLIANSDADEIDIDDLMPFNCSFRFSQILEDSDLTNKILNPSTNANDDDNTPRRITKRKNSCGQKERKITASAAFNNLDSSEKTFFRRRNLPMGMVHYLDSCVFSFFQNDPTGTYISEPLSSYERMMLHGISHYYRLNSTSYNSEPQDIRLTKVTNNHVDFNPPCTCLSQYLEEGLQKVASKLNNPDKRRRFKRTCTKSY